MFLKKFEQLLAEVEVQDALWGDPAGKSGVCATVSHQHIYGFLFKFLWPLITGRTVWSDACFYPADIQDAVVQLKQCTLVSTPSHLKRLPALLDWSVVRGACTAIFSSGGPLPESAAVEVQFGLGQAPHEIFGSTETGGVAWRQLQKAGEACAWTPFPGIHIRQESDTGCLQVASPFIHPSELSDGWYTMQDSIALEASGCFHLKGRVDRIVKIEQKRVSLEHMEQRLMQLDGIDDAAVALLSDGTAQSGRSRLGAAIVLSESGLQQADALSSSQLNDHIKQHLLAWFEPTVLPRAFVFVDRLPENAQGKKPLAEIRALFNKKDNPESTLPSICSEETDDHSVTLQCEVPADLVYFDGHFDALPVVAGVVQIHWAMKLAEQYFGVTVNATQLEAIKFHKLLFPRDRFTLSLRHSNEPEKIHFSLAQGENKFSSGRVAI
jgi:acyl-coenzyme A synthetase/AMP-(fatty) acid ligase/3-hydroxymyristoyl/3-hydroxydecanoyl-(acyl carrier protein) dehydratase